MKLCAIKKTYCLIARENEHFITRINPAFKGVFRIWIMRILIIDGYDIDSCSLEKQVDKIIISHSRKKLVAQVVFEYYHQGKLGNIFF